MSPPVVVLYALLGLLLAGAIWSLAAAQAGRRPFRAGPVCAECGARLSAAGWLPLAGFGLALRCRTCGALQPIRRVVFELAVAGYFALVALRAESGWRLVGMALFAAPLLWIMLVDWWTRFIYTNVVLAGVLAGLVYWPFEDGLGGLLRAILAALIAVAIFLVFFALAALIYRNLRVVPFGLGDVYLAGMIGVMVGVPRAVLVALFYGILLGGLAVLVLPLLGRVKRRDPIAYGPYLCLGALLALMLQTGG